jgi:uncharacterized membrane protein
MATGLPTVLGWDVHERLWRGNAAENNTRADHIQIMYESDKPEKVKKYTDHYNIRYIIVGEPERRKFGRIHSRLFDSSFRKIISDGDNAVYEVTDSL